MDKSVLSAKILDTGVTQCGDWCSLRTYEAVGNTEVTPTPQSRPVPPPALGPALTSPWGFRRRVTQLRLE